MLVQAWKITKVWILAIYFPHLDEWDRRLSSAHWKRGHQAGSFCVVTFLVTAFLTFYLLLSKANISNTYLVMSYSYLVNDLNLRTISGIQPRRAETFFCPSLPDRIYGLFDHDQTACRWMANTRSGGGARARCMADAGKTRMIRFQCKIKGPPK